MEITQLKELAGHFPAAHIGAQIGRGTHGVLKQIKKLGLPSYVNAPPKPRPVASPKPVKAKVEAKRVVRQPVAPLKPTAVRQAQVKHISYPPLEWCPTCHSPVSSWIDHEKRMGCKRPAE
jgi:hypothetical protein